MAKAAQTNILYLEDDPDSRDLVGYLLKQAGINVVFAETVAEAWQLAMSSDIDLFLLDGLIPNGDSLRLCRDLRMMEPQKPIVFYSGLAFEADILRGLEAGATAYLVKPYSGDLARDLLCLIFNIAPGDTAEPVFLTRKNVMDAFSLNENSDSGESIAIVELPADFPVTIWNTSPTRPKKLISSRLKRTRIMRAARGMF